jgi:hypothetical protein
MMGRQDRDQRGGCYRRGERLGILGTKTLNLEPANVASANAHLAGYLDRHRQCQPSTTNRPMRPRR